ncbi:MAG TPA: amidohydrolase family protein, partial [Blastococcus sp.]
GIGWVPYILERTDYTWERHKWYQDVDMDTRPSDLFREHFWGCFIDDEHGLKNRHSIGIDRIMLEVDFPHSDSNWPNSRKRASEVLADVPDDEVEKIVETNARRMLRFPR